MLTPARQKIFLRQREFALAGVILFSFFSSAQSQWYRLASFQDHIGVIYFLDLPGPPRIGFVGTGYSSRDAHADVWKTLDGGLTWTLSKLPPDKFNHGITNFAFIDTNEGFFSSGFTSASPKAGCFRTTDGGDSWNMILQGSGDAFTSIHYNRYSNVLLISRWKYNSLISLDQGNSFTEIPNSYSNNGMAFSNDLEGIATVVTFDLQNPFPFSLKKTVDGGVTWREVPYKFEAWQPFSVPYSSSYIAVSEYPPSNGNVFRSDDAGESWRQISSVPFNRGHIVGDEKHLYTQSFKYGIMRSTDGGYSWQSICGPYNEYEDTRMYYKSNYLYAHDVTIDVKDDTGRLWVNTTGSGSGERLLLKHLSNASEVSLAAGDRLAVDLALPDTFSTLQWLKLDSITFTIRFQRDLFSVERVDAAAGWRVANFTEEYDRVRVKLLRESGADRGVPVGSVNFIANIADSVESDIYIDSVWYNDGEFTNCEIIPSEKLHVTITNNCGDSLLRDLIRQQHFELVSIRPNPAKDKITVDVRMPVAGAINVSVVDPFGVTLSMPQQTLGQGLQSFVLDLTYYGSGAYILNLTFFDDRATGNFVLVQ